MKSLKYFSCAVALSVLFRLPFLLNPEQMTSDHAFLGLQAMEMVRGKYQWFLWGSNYQAALEPLLASFLFRVFGSNFFVLQWVPFIAFIGCLGILYRTLVPEIGAKKTFLLSLLWVFASRPFVEVTVIPYRQWSLLLSFLAFGLVLSIRAGRRVAPFGAAFVPFVALFVDFFTIVFFVPVVFLGAWVAKEHRKLTSFSTCFVFGGLSLILTRLSVKNGPPLAFSPKTLIHNVPLFFETCLPVVLGAGYLERSPWDWAGFFISVAAIFFLSYRAIVFLCSAPPTLASVKVAFGLFLFVTTVVGFMGSSMASDVWSVRYLLPLLYALPYMMLPLAMARRHTVFVVTTLLILFPMSVGSWRQMSPMTSGMRVVVDPISFKRDAIEIKRELETKRVMHGFSDYWIAYQLSFLFQNELMIVPFAPGADRFGPYREEVLKQKEVFFLISSRNPEGPEPFVEAEKKKGTYLEHFQRGQFGSCQSKVGG